jgi:hypothetical protein
MRCRAAGSHNTTLSECADQNIKEDKANGAEEEDEGETEK